MPTAPSFSESDLMAVSKVLADAASHAELTLLFNQVGLDEPKVDQNLSKARRIYVTLATKQNQTHTGNFAMALIQHALAPRRFMANPTSLDPLRSRMNELLAFRGMRLRNDGKFERVIAATTIDEARERADRLRAELERRDIHADVLAFCRAELLQQNYFHAVLEATKSVGEKLRTRTGLSLDGGQLASTALGLGQHGPFLAFNPLADDSHESEQKGLMNLFVGMFGTFRNPTAHAPKIHWDVTERDAVDLLSLVSLLHRRLDSATRTNREV